ncbi:circularly permuted type 2 ATP-grasp protein [Methylosinus sp. LW4]|uniref:circularly permuted type 2 ATP-grasp protein n=1 Tax=Methylosinus sp. LW4 TaxID=136993 RepID=UPI00036447C2|nr:circularly permuted type 2 ATP-grasp protein [Methylosinus sp. LW4]
MPAERTIDASTGEAARRVAAWIARYAPPEGVPDELVGPDGRVRPHWASLLDTLGGLSREDIDDRFAAAGRRIRDMGVSYRVLGETKERTWPLSRLPLLLPQAEWREIAAGVAQRAELLDMVLRDAYGEQRLVKEGALPAAVIAGSPDYIRPMSGATPPGGRWLRFYAAEIGRGPDGRWWVLGDRAQAPSGAGYSLENRLVMARTFPRLYRDMKVERLAPFFRDFRSALAKAAQQKDPRICLLTPGPFSESYSEQVSLARYLGFLLVEGADLVTSERKLHVRTIAGLKRVDVVWRRVDADWCDPLELNAASQLGVPGLLDTIREGNVTIANMPGAGLIESRALLSFLPAIARRLLGEDLRLANIATWWCGQDEARDAVLASLEDRAVAPAFGEHLAGFPGRRVALGAEFDAAERARLTEAMRARGMDYVGQEVVQLSTTPVWQDGALVPRPFALRVFAAATADGWRVMPGGFCRVSDRLDVRAISMGAGAQSADVWVLGDRPTDNSTLLPMSDDVEIVRMVGDLPSRAADNLFWMGRYFERAEATLRLVRSLCNRLTEADAPNYSGRQPIERLERVLLAWGAAPTRDPRLSAAELALAAAGGTETAGSALSIARAAEHAASIVRERLSQDIWHLVRLLEARLDDFSQGPASEPEVLEGVEQSLHVLAALSGLIDENFNRVAGWCFLDLGKRVERAINACRFSRQFADEGATIDSLDTLLELIDSQITYRSRYLAGAALAPVLDMAVLDPYNPRSVGFQVAKIEEHLSSLPTLRHDGLLEAPRRLAVKLRAEIEVANAAELDAAKIFAIEQRLMSLADALASRYFLQGSNAAHFEEPIRLA